MFQLSLVFKKRSFLFSIASVYIISCLGFILECITYFGSELVELPSAEKVFLWSSGNNISALCLIYLLPVFVVLPFADSFITEKEENSLPILLHRTGAKKYFFEKIFATAISAFVVTIPLIINFILCIITFPVEVNDYWKLSADQSFYFTEWRMEKILFPSLSLRYPYFYNFLFIILTGLFCSIISILICQISFFLSHTRTLILSIFFIANNLIALLSNLTIIEGFYCTSFFNYLIAGNYDGDKEILFFISMFLVPIVLILALIHPCINRIKKIWG